MDADRVCAERHADHRLIVGTAMVGMYLPPDIMDLTAQTPLDYRVRNRLSARIDSVVLHQTAFSRGNVPDLYLKVHAHFVVMPDGRILQLHPIAAYLVASSAFNEDSVAIEFVGNFPNDRGQYWQGDRAGRHVLSAQQISGGRHLVRHLRDTRAISFIFAHRQGEDVNRRGNCPGPDIWCNIGEWAIRELSMSDGGKGHTEGDGSAIPDSWRRPRA